MEVNNGELVLSRGVYRTTYVGLEVSGESTPQEWEAYGEQLVRVEEARQWAIGDWLRDGKRHYGDGLYRKAAGILGCSEKSLWQWKHISDRFEFSIRMESLSWKHHQTVASVKSIVETEDGLALSDEPDHERIQEFLKDAERRGWSTSELRDEVRRYKESQRERIRLANEPDKYSVIYADPPWKYMSGDQHTDETQETVLGDHYPSMTLDEICELPVKQMASEDAVLFLWCTSPTLEEAFDVIRAWGFSYKTSMVWDKVHHNVGNYVSVRHELLLICTRGAPPRVSRLEDSVYVEERTDHSRKPVFFRELIDELYPCRTSSSTSDRVELFPRGSIPSWWSSWGNEAP